MAEDQPKRKFHSRYILYGLLVIAIIAWFVSFGLIIFNKGNGGECVRINDTNQFDETAGNPKKLSGPQVKCLRLERVSSPEELERGLSGRQSMDEDQGMLFTFAQTGKHCFWMKDMNFSIDIIWLDADKKVVTVKENVTPETYPESFCPDQPAKYVLEVNAGVADRALISPGSQLQF